VAVFPELSWQWKLETSDRQKWPQFQLEDFRRLKKNYGVTRVIVSKGKSVGLPCAYENSAVMVCEIP